MQLIVSVFPIKIQSPQYLKQAKSINFQFFYFLSFRLFFNFCSYSFLFLNLSSFYILCSLTRIMQQLQESSGFDPWKSLSFVPSSVVSSLCQRTSRCRNPRLTTTGDYHWSDNFRKSTELISRRWGQWQGEGWFPLDFL